MEHVQTGPTHPYVGFKPYVNMQVSMPVSKSLPSGTGMHIVYEYRRHVHVCTPNMHSTYQHAHLTHVGIYQYRHTTSDNMSRTMKYICTVYVCLFVPIVIFQPCTYLSAKVT